MATESDHLQTPSMVSRALTDTMLYLRNRDFWLLAGAACLLTGFGGPFGTNEIMPLTIRLGFWTIVLGMAILLLTYLSFLAHRINARLGYHWAMAAAAAATVGSPIVYAGVVVVYWALLPDGPGFSHLQTFMEVLVPSVIVNVIVNGYISLPDDLDDRRETGVVRALRRHDPSITAPLPEDQSLFFENLPPKIGRDIVCIRADDHYIEVRTTIGEARILMRLRDAEVTLSTLRGLRVHRSWWVNMEHALALEPRAGGGGLLSLRHGETVPVSRGQMETVEHALALRDPQPSH